MNVLTNCWPSLRSPGACVDSAPILFESESKLHTGRQGATCNATHGDDPVGARTLDSDSLGVIETSTVSTYTSLTLVVIKEVNRDRRRCVSTTTSPSDGYILE